MCTAVSFYADGLYFGRTLDYENSYGEDIVIMPRRFRLAYAEGGALSEHYAVIGTAHVAQGYPLFYDAVNEKGLAMGGLNFVGNAVYREPCTGRENIAQYELIPRILSCCADTKEAEKLLSRVNITNTSFSNDMPTAQLHWILADADRTITVEAMQNGLYVHENPVGVLTNNPPFQEQLFRLNDYMHLSAKKPQNTFGGNLPLKHYSRGMGAIGLPGDVSSQSRFVRAAFTRANALTGQTELENVGQVFHIMGTVEQVKGCCEVGEGEYEHTIYTACADAKRGVYYYTGYHCRQITAVSMHHEDLEGTELYCYPMQRTERVYLQN